MYTIQKANICHVYYDIFAYYLYIIFKGLTIWIKIYKNTWLS